MELYNTINNNLIENKDFNLEKQKSFLETSLGKVINIGLDTGIRALLPDVIEEQVINIKDEIINNGFNAGIKEAISSAIDLGKSVVGVFTGKFENVSQARNAVKNGGIIDSISKTLDNVINICSKKGKIPNTFLSVIKRGKNALVNNITNNIEKEFNNQINSVEKISKNSENWKQYYNNKDFKGMEREYEKIKKELQKTIPLEKTIKQARSIENLHMLIKNKGGDFNLKEEEIELAKKLA